LGREYLKNRCFKCFWYFAQFQIIDSVAALIGLGLKKAVFGWVCHLCFCSRSSSGSQSCSWDLFIHFNQLYYKEALL